MDRKLHLELGKENQRSSESGDLSIRSTKQRPPSPAPYAWHDAEGEKPSKSRASPHSRAAASPANIQSPNVHAPYAQPVLDASKLQANKRVMTSVDDRIASVRERRLQQQQVQGILPVDASDLDKNTNSRFAKEEASRAKWEQSQEDKRKKIEEQKDKETQRRKEVEERKTKQMTEDKKRAEAIVARTDQQANVVLRQKRAASADRTKRWSWGAGGMAGGGGPMPCATHVPTAPSPFHYYDPTRVTKRIPSSESQRKRPMSMDFSGFDSSSIARGDEGSNAASPAAGALIGQSKPLQADDRFSKSPLVMNTNHMKFASGLRSYDSTPTSSVARKPSSPAPSPRSRRPHSTDARSKSRKDTKDIDRNNKDTPEAKNVTRGRSTDVRKSPNSKPKGSSVSPQITDPASVSSRLLAPTQASIARSINRDLDELSTTSSNASVTLRSRSSDRKRPSSTKSDSSDASSNVSSPRPRNTAKPKRTSSSRGTSPSLKSRSKPRPPSPVVRATTPTGQRGHSPKPRSPVVKETPKFPKRGPSPVRLSSSPKSSSSLTKKSSLREPPHLGKSPPLIKQSLTPTNTVSRPKPTPAHSPTTGSLMKKVNKKVQENDKATAKKTNAKTNQADNVARNEQNPDTKLPSKNVMNETYIVTPPTTDHSIATEDDPAGRNAPVPAEDNTTSAETSDVQSAKQELVASEIEKHEDTDDSTAMQDESSVSSHNHLLPSNQPNLAEELQSAQSEEGTTSIPADSNEVMEAMILPDSSPSPPHYEDGVVDEAAVKLSDDVIEQAQAELQNELTLEVTGQAGTNDEANLEDDLVHQENDEREQKYDEPEQNYDVAEQKDDVSEEKDDVANENKEVDDASTMEQSENQSKDSASVDVVVDETESKVEENSEQQPATDLEEVASPPSDDVLQPTPAIENGATPQEGKVADEEKTTTIEEKVAPVVEENKKKEKKLTAEEQAYKDAITAKRREMKEKREREEKERQERLKVEAEQQARREEDARRMAEEARLEHERMMEEERIKKEEQEKKKKKEAEEMARKHEEFLKEQREKVEQKAREEAEKGRKDRELAAQKKEEERLVRKKRLEMIMRRTRGGDSPTSNVTSSNATPPGGVSPANTTPVRGNSPSTPLTPDRVNSPVNSGELKEIVNNSEPKDSIIASQGDSNIETIKLENYVQKPSVHVNGESHAPPLLAFAAPPANENLFSGTNFSPVGSGNARNILNSINGNSEDPMKADKLLTTDTDNMYNNTTAAIPDEQVPTGNLLDL